MSFFCLGQITLLCLTFAVHELIILTDDSLVEQLELLAKGALTGLPRTKQQHLPHTRRHKIHYVTLMQHKGRKNLSNYQNTKILSISPCKQAIKTG